MQRCQSAVLLLLLFSVSVSLAQAPEVTTDTFPRINGSTSALPLQRLFAARLLDVPCGWYGKGLSKFPLLIFGPSNFNIHAMAPVGAEITMARHRDNVMRATFVNHLFHAGTNPAYVQLIEGTAELILVARAPSSSEIELAAADGVTLDVRPVALDALVFLVHEENSVRDLSTAQLQRIFSTPRLNWSEFGGADQEIQTFIRESDSGSQELLETRVMGDTPVHTLEPAEVLRGMSGPFDRLPDETGGISFTVFYYEQRMIAGEQVRLLGVDGVFPTTETIANRTYPYVTEVYVAVREDAAPDSQAVRLRDWMLSPDGQAIVAESGYAPIGN